MKKSTLKKISLSLGALTLVSTPILSTIACGGGSSKSVVENQELKSFVNDQVKSYVSDLSAENALKMLAGPNSKINGNMQQLIPHTITFEGKSIATNFIYQINSTHLLIGTTNAGLLQVMLDGNGKIIEDSIVKYNDITGKLPSSFNECFAIKIDDTHLFIGTSENGLLQVELNSNNYLVKNVIQFPIGTADIGELPNRIVSAIKIDDTHLIVSGENYLYEISISNGVISSCSKYPNLTMLGTHADPILLSKNKILFSYLDTITSADVFVILSIDSNGVISKIDPYTFSSGFNAGYLYYSKIKSTYFFYYRIPVIEDYNKIILGDISTDGVINSYDKDLKFIDAKVIRNVVQIKSNLALAATSDGGAKLIKIDPITGLPISNEIISFPIWESNASYGTLPKGISKEIQSINSHVIIGVGDLYDCLINPFDSNVTITSSTKGTTQKLIFHMDGYSDETLSWTTN